MAPKLLIVKLKIIVVEGQHKILTSKNKKAPKHAVQMQKKEKVKGQRRTHSHKHTNTCIMLGQTKCVGAMTFFKFK